MFQQSSTRTERGWYAILLTLSTVAGFVGGSTHLRAQQIAITVDDLPAHSALPPGETRVDIARKIIAALTQAGVPPTYGFVNGVRIEEQPGNQEVLTLWRAAGNPLGNHTWSHMNLADHSVEAWKADTLRNEPVLQSAMGDKDWHWLRYPNLSEGSTPEKRDSVRAFLAGHHYRIAGVTMSFGDYLWNEPYARCMAQDNQEAVRTLEETYLQAAADEADYRRAMAKELFGKDIPYVLLMHIGAMDARMFPRLLALYRSKGFRFVSLEQAERDPFYANDLDPRLPAAPDTFESALALRGLPLPVRPVSHKPAADLCKPSGSHVSP